MRRALAALPEAPPENAVDHRVGGVRVSLASDHDTAVFYVGAVSTLGAELIERALRCPRLD